MVRGTLGRRAVVGGVAAMVLAASGCGTPAPADVPLPLPKPSAVDSTSTISSSSSAAGWRTRNAPGKAPYSLHTNPSWYGNLANAMDYVPAPLQGALKRLEKSPIAEWMSPDLLPPRRDVDAGHAAGQIPVLVAYDIPHRDLDGHSAGGLPDGTAYRQWVDDVSDLIGDNNAVLIVEPDALMQMIDMTDPPARAERLALLQYALKTFARNKNTAVYLDAGNASWRSADDVARLLREVESGGVQVPGIALNVSSRHREETTRAYAEQIEKAFGRPLYVMIDNSVNGAPNTDDLDGWCNPSGRKIGSLSDTIFDPDARVEEMYIKTPANSDGVCGTSRRPAGVFDGALLVKELQP